MKIVCFGDSLTSCGGENGRFSDILQERFPGHEFINRGVGSDTFVEALERLDADVLRARPDVVLLEFGACDWWLDERAPGEWVADLGTCILRILECDARPVVLGVFGDCLDADGRRVPKVVGTDARALVYRDLERAVAEKHNCPYHPNIQERIIGNRCCWLDTNHPNEFGNRNVADSIEPLLAEMLTPLPRAIDARPCGIKSLGMH